MRTPWLWRIGRIAIAIAVVVAVLALPAAIWWLWELSSLLNTPAVIEITFIAVVVLLAAIWWLWWRLPKRQVHGLDIQIHDPKARADTEDNFRKTVGQALGGAAVLIGAGAAYLQFTQQQRASHDLLISNQVAKSFEQLGSTETATRLGGIYGLENVMNAPGGQYHQPVLEALCAFVREGATRRRQVGLAALLEAWSAVGDGAAKKRPTTDIQAALTVIGRRADGPGTVNLTRADLRGATLSGVNLSGADLIGANVSGANLHGANLSDAALLESNLDGANLIGANLSDANLFRANLTGAFLFRANLSGANLNGANLTGANGVSLPGADLGATLDGATLDGANLTDANLRAVRNLRPAQLERSCGQPAALPEGFPLDFRLADCPYDWEKTRQAPALP